MKKLICILLVIMVIIAVFSGCCCKEKEEVPTRFKVVDEIKAEPNATYNSYILVDIETNVLYLYYNGIGEGCGFAALVDADGKPLLWEG